MAGGGELRNIGLRHLRLAAKSNEELGRLLIPHIDTIENEESHSDSEGTINNLSVLVNHDGD
ncbi:hypothetical protein HWV62_27628 [Athelia sp. TMB]|nr:hypothetical protein HWV62_27628 [Athelia sp. TMB]